MSTQLKMPPPTMMTLSLNAQEIRADMASYKEETDLDPSKFDPEIWENLKLQYAVAMERLEHAVVMQLHLAVERHPDSWMDRVGRLIARVMAEAIED